MGKIKVSGYLHSDDFAAEMLDPTHPTGLTEDGQDEVMRTEIEELTDIRIVFEK